MPVFFGFATCEYLLLQLPNPAGLSRVSFTVPYFYKGVILEPEAQKRDKFLITAAWPQLAKFMECGSLSLIAWFTNRPLLGFLSEGVVFAATGNFNFAGKKPTPDTR